MEHQKENGKRDDKPVGYGSSIQSSGHGNRSRPPQKIDKNQTITDAQGPGEEKEKENDQ